VLSATALMAFVNHLVFTWGLFSLGLRAPTLSASIITPTGNIELDPNRPLEEADKTWNHARTAKAWFLQLEPSEHTVGLALGDVHQGLPRIRLIRWSRSFRKRI